MRLLCCIVSYNRPEYTKRTIESWLNTCGEDDDLIVVDNASDQDGSQLAWYDLVDYVIWNRRNLFPGAACNIGWQHGQRDLGPFQLLQRSDNDIEYLPGWREEVEKAFTNFIELGQLGILNLHEDFNDEQPVEPWETDDCTLNVWAGPHGVTAGGNCVIRQSLWADGLRWPADPWRPGANEDTYMSAAVVKAGLRVARVIPTVANNISYGRFADYPDYYRYTAGLRGLVPELSV
jgi:glycosyltransferase involved in cell wall biosynthesis